MVGGRCARKSTVRGIYAVARLGLGSELVWMYTRDGWLPSADLTRDEKFPSEVYLVNLLNSFDIFLVCWLGGSEVGVD